MDINIFMNFVTGHVKSLSEFNYANIEKIEIGRNIASNLYCKIQIGSKNIFLYDNGTLEINERN